MTTEPKKNVVASVLARLKNKATSTGESYNVLLQHYVLERFLARISQSPHAHGVVLKGALLLKTLNLPRARPTMDIDMLRRGKADRDTLVAIVKDCALIEDPTDGVTFLPESIVAKDIDKDGGYQGTRVTFDARMSNVRLQVQIDFGVGDVMVPGPREIRYPTIIHAAAVNLLAYPLQSAIAEKLQAIVQLGEANSRMKDFYDVWTCSRSLDFDGSLLEAIEATFKRRATQVPDEPPVAFTQEFIDGHRVQWSAFVRKIGEKELADQFGQVVVAIQAFAMPALTAVARGEPVASVWKAGQGWQGLEIEIAEAPTPSR